VDPTKQLPETVSLVLIPEPDPGQVTPDKFCHVFFRDPKTTRPVLNRSM
jgi:hypothetical protein